VPLDLPARFRATLDADVYALLAHRILDGDNRHLVHEPKEGEDLIVFHAEVDREAETVHLIDFPPVTDHVGTDLGEIEATVSVEGDPGGYFHPTTGHVEIDVTLKFAPRHMLARTSRVTVSLRSDERLEQPELDATGVPFTSADRSLTLVGHGTFEGGTLNGGSIWLAIACYIEDITEQE
jgi:hypothetical protein